MKIEKRFYSNIKRAITVVGIKEAGFSTLADLVENLQSEEINIFTTSIPDFFLKDKKNQIEIDGLFFNKVIASKKIEMYKNKNFEFLIVLLSSANKISVSNSRFRIANDPYTSIKELPYDEKSIVIFYSPNHHDIELFIPEKLYEEIYSRIKELT